MNAILTCSYHSSTLVGKQASVIVCPTAMATEHKWYGAQRKALLTVSRLGVTSYYFQVVATSSLYRNCTRLKHLTLPCFHLLELMNASVAGMTIVATARLAAEVEGSHPNVDPMSLVPTPQANRAGAPSIKLIADFLPSGCGSAATDVKGGTNVEYRMPFSAQYLDGIGPL